VNDPRIPYAKQPEPAVPEGYSATALGSDWFDPPGETVRRPAPDRTAPGAPVPGPVTPDRVEGEVLRFGPGVTAAVQARFRDRTATLARDEPPLPAPEQRRHGGLRQYTLAALVLLAVLAFLAWQRFGPALAVRDVSAHTTAGTLGCGATADVVGTVVTNGRPGTVTYHWVRSDGTVSPTLHEKVTRGQRQAHLHLLWTVRGRGEFGARAQLRVTSPSRHTAAAHFTYRCR
jgi:hypothetical protein